MQQNSNLAEDITFAILDNDGTSSDFNSDSTNPDYINYLKKYLKDGDKSFENLLIEGGEKGKKVVDPGKKDEFELLKSNIVNDDESQASFLADKIFPEDKEKKAVFKEKISQIISSYRKKIEGNEKEYLEKKDEVKQYVKDALSSIEFFKPNEVESKIRSNLANRTNADILAKGPYPEDLAALDLQDAATIAGTIYSGVFSFLGFLNGDTGAGVIGLTGAYLFGNDTYESLFGKEGGPISDIFADDSKTTKVAKNNIFRKDFQGKFLPIKGEKDEVSKQKIINMEFIYKGVNFFDLINLSNGLGENGKGKIENLGNLKEKLDEIDKIEDPDLKNKKKLDLVEALIDSGIINREIEVPKESPENGDKKTENNKKPEFVKKNIMDLEPPPDILGIIDMLISDYKKTEVGEKKVLANEDPADKGLVIKNKRDFARIMNGYIEDGDESITLMLASEIGHFFNPRANPR